MSSVPGHTAHPERPERSRNAKAQARHRAKRKAYIEQLEATVTKLQTALGFSPEQVAALPPPFVKIRELEQDVERLQRENDELRRMLGDRGLPMDMTRRNSFTTYQDSRACDRDYKRRKMTGHMDGVYISPSDTPPQGDNITRPPPLTIPQPHHHYASIQTSSNHNNSSMFSLHAPAFQMPNTPSGSSATSSPPFSPAQMQASVHSAVNHRQPLTNHHALTNYSHSGQYDSVKVEEDGYNATNTHPSHPPHAGHYSLPPYNPSPPDNNGMDTWHTYSSERAQQLHR